MASYLNITSWSHKKLIDLIRAEFPEDVLWGEIKTKLVEKKPNSKNLTSFKYLFSLFGMFFFNYTKYFWESMKTIINIKIYKQTTNNT